MSVAVNCECGHRAFAKDSFAGKRVRCPTCGRTIQIPNIEGPSGSRVGSVIPEGGSSLFSEATIMAAQHLRAMSIDDILRTTFRLYRTRFVPFLLITMMAYVPFGLVKAGIDVSILTFDRSITGIRGDNPQYLKQLDGWTDPRFVRMSVEPLILVLVIWPLCGGALAHSVSAAFLGEELGAWESYLRAFPHVIRMMITQFLAGLVIMPGVFVIQLIVLAPLWALWPGVPLSLAGFATMLCSAWRIALAFSFFLMSPVVMLENHGITGSLGRSWELIRGSIGKAFGLGLVIVIIGGMVRGITALIVVLVTLQLALDVEFAWAFLGVLVSAVILPVQIAPAILLYYDIRIRKEAFDLQVLTGLLGKPAPV